MSDVLAAIDDIRALQTVRGELPQGEVVTAALRYHVIVIGEAVHHLPEYIRRGDTWRPYLELRNHLAHEYFRLDDARLLRLLADPLDDLERAARELLRER